VFSFVGFGSLVAPIPMYCKQMFAERCAAQDPATDINIKFKCSSLLESLKSDRRNSKRERPYCLRPRLLIHRPVKPRLTRPRARAASCPRSKCRAGRRRPERCPGIADLQRPRRRTENDCGSCRGQRNQRGRGTCDHNNEQLHLATWAFQLNGAFA